MSLLSSLQAPTSSEPRKELSWALLDQGAVSLGNFALNILLARELTAAQYGSFAVLFGLLLVLNNFHSALVGYPLSVDLSHRSAQLKSFTSINLLCSLLLTVLLIPLLVAATFFIGQPQLIVPLCAALLFWQLQETVRRILMARLRFKEVFAGDVVSYIGQSVIIGALSFKASLTIPIILQIIALTSAVAFLLQAHQLGVGETTILEVTSTIRRYWVIGKWALLTNTVVGLTALQAFVWMTAYLRGSAEAGALQASANLLSLTHPISLALGNLIVPVAARAASQSGLSLVWPSTKRYIYLFAFAILPYLLVVATWPNFVSRVFYGPSSPYGHLDLTVRIITLAYSLNFIGQAFGWLLRSVHNSRADFLANAYVMIPCLALAVWTTRHWGIPGAALAMAAMSASRVLLLGKFATNAGIFAATSTAEHAVC